MNIKFKHFHIKEQLEHASVVLQFVALDMATFVLNRFDKEITITRVTDSVSGESGVHLDARAFDVRDEHAGERFFSDDQVLEILHYLNTRWKRSDGFSTAIHHAFQGGMKHFHVQIPLSVKAYEGSGVLLEDRFNFKQIKKEMDMSEEHGIKETKELLIGVNELSLVLIKNLQDGLQMGKDVAAIFSELLGNDELKSKLAQAVEDVKKAPDEIKDLSVAEGVELGMIQVQYVEKILDAVKGSPKEEAKPEES